MLYLHHQNEREKTQKVKGKHLNNFHTPKEVHYEYEL